MSKNILTDAQNKWFYGVVRHRLREIRKMESAYSELHTEVNEAFAAGARWNMQTTSQLAPYVAQFCEMIILLGLFDAENTTLENERNSPLWHTESAGTPGDYAEPPY